MNAPAPVRLVSAKLTAVGRVQTFLLDEAANEEAPRPGEEIVVQTDNGQTIASVVASIPQIEDKRRAAADPSHQVVRRASRDDIVARLKGQQKEREAANVATLKIRERGLGMKLARVESILDDKRSAARLMKACEQILIRTPAYQACIELEAEWSERVTQRLATLQG